MSPSSDAAAVTILVLSSGDGTGINFVRCLRRAGGYRTIGVDTFFDDHITSEADERLLVSADGDRLIEIINEIAHRYGVDLIYAADTNAVLELVSRERDRLAAPTFLPDYDDHVLVEDKWRTYQNLAALGLSVPETGLIRDDADLVGAFARHSSVWLRRIRGSGGAGSLATDSVDLARAWIDSGNGWGEFTAAEQLSRRTATFSGVWHEGNLVASQLRERTSWKYAHLSASGVTGITSGQKTLWNVDLHELAVRSIVQTMSRPHGAVGVDFTYGHDGVPRVTEIQPARFYSSMEFLAAVGINLPDIYCRLALGRPLPTTELINPIRSSHYWFKAVDKLPLLMSQQEVELIEPMG